MPNAVQIYKISTDSFSIFAGEFVETQRNNIK